MRLNESRGHGLIGGHERDHGFRVFICEGEKSSLTEKEGTRVSKLDVMVTSFFFDA